MASATRVKMAYRGQRRDDDGVCDADEVTGCTDPAACNYDSDPTTDTDNTLCTFVDGVCETCEDGLIVDNDATTTASVMPTRSPVAPTRSLQLRQRPTTDTDNTLCTFVDGVCETCVDGMIVDNDADNDGVCDADEVTGCTDPAACNYDSDPTTDTDNTLCTLRRWRSARPARRADRGQRRRQRWRL